MVHPHNRKRPELNRTLLYQGVITRVYYTCYASHPELHRALRYAVFSSVNYGLAIQIYHIPFINSISFVCVPTAVIHYLLTFRLSQTIPDMFRIHFSPDTQKSRRMDFSIHRLLALFSVIYLLSVYPILKMPSNSSFTVAPVYSYDCCRAASCFLSLSYP